MELTSRPRLPSPEAFVQLAERVVAELPPRFRRYLDNVAIVVEDDPTPEQRRRSGTRQHQLLLGLYEGVPRIERQGRPTLLPDRITLFRRSLLEVAQGRRGLATEIRRTIVHEVGHHLGLSEAAVRRIANAET